MGLEKWLPVLNYEDKYLISNYGRIKSLKTNSLMKPSATKDNYLRVRLYKDGIYTSKMIHVLVAEVFLEKPQNNKNNYEVDHIDCNPQNNNVNNLRWLTRKENLDRSFSLGHQSKPKKEVFQYDLKNNFIAKYESVNEAFRQTNIRHISEVARGERKTAGGYIWKYKERSDDL